MFAEHHTLIVVAGVASFFVVWLTVAVPLIARIVIAAEHGRPIGPSRRPFL